MSTERSSPTSDRLVSLDAYRGFTMLLMASGAFALARVARMNAKWSPVANQFDHPSWTGTPPTFLEGCTIWDLIQPSFMFIVGVSMVFSYAARSAKGQAWARQAVHAVKRAALLILIGMFLDWYSSSQLTFQLIRVLQQIAIGYLIAFAVLPLGPKVQGVTAILLLVGHTAAFMVYGQLEGIAPWHRELNVGRQIDLKLHEILGYQLSTGYYVTFNAISSAGTILMGALAGELLKSPGSQARKVTVLLGAGSFALAVGWALSGGGGWIPFSFTPSVPMIKRLWTASFALFAAGWTILLLAAFYLVIDVLNWRWWSFPFVVVGMNSIAMYVIAELFRSDARRFANLIVPPVGVDADTATLARRRLVDFLPVVDFSNWTVRFGVDLSQWYFTPIIESVIVLAVFWLACYWLYRHKIFFKV